MTKSRLMFNLAVFTISLLIIVTFFRFGMEYSEKEYNKTVQFANLSINNNDIISSQIVIESSIETYGLFGQHKRYYIITENSEKIRNKYIISEHLYINIDKNDTINFYNGYNEDDSTKVKELFMTLNKSTSTHIQQNLINLNLSHNNKKML